MGLSENIIVVGELVPPTTSGVTSNDAAARALAEPEQPSELAALLVRLAALVEDWRRRAYAWNNFSPIDHRAAQVYRQAADDMAALLAQAPPP